MIRHAFPFGSAVAAEQLLSESEDGERYRRTVQDLFNRVVLENDLKWFHWRSHRERTLAALKWLREHGLPVRGHTLVWPSWHNSPREWESLQKDSEGLRRAVRDHVTEEASAVRGQVVEWDVINEPYANDQIMEVLGEDVMVEWFRAARAADPEAKLYINDYGILSAGGIDRRHQDHYHETIRMLIEKGAPIEGIGMQGHFGSHLTPPERLWEILDRFAELGLEIQITEFDINNSDEMIQAAYTRDFLTAMFAHPAVKGVLTWGFWEGRHWIPKAAMFRRDWSLKSNGQAWIDLVKKQWWTDEQGTTDATGRYTTRGFLGDYQVEASAGTGSVRQTATLTEAGLELRLVLAGER